MFSHHIDSALKEGKVLIIENLASEVDVSLMQLLDSYSGYRRSYNLRTDHLLKFDGKSYRALSSFKVLLTSSLELPKFSIAL